MAYKYPLIYIYTSLLYLVQVGLKVPGYKHDHVPMYQQREVAALCLKDGHILALPLQQPERRAFSGGSFWHNWWRQGGMYMNINIRICYIYTYHIYMYIHVLVGVSTQLEKLVHSGWTFLPQQNEVASQNKSWCTREGISTYYFYKSKHIHCWACVVLHVQPFTETSRWIVAVQRCFNTTSSTCSKQPIKQPWKRKGQPSHSLSPVFTPSTWRWESQKLVTCRVVKSGLKAFMKDDYLLHLSLLNIYIWMFPKKCYPQIIHFNSVFLYKPSILEYPYFWKHPNIYIYYIYYRAFKMLGFSAITKKPFWRYQDCTSPIASD